MSSEANNSSANSCISSDVGSAHSSHVALSDEAQRVYQLTDDLIVYLSTIIESRLPVARLDIDPVSSTQLESIRAQTSRISDDTSHAFIDLLKLAKSYHSKLQELRFKFMNNEPILNSEFEYEGKSFKMKGIAIIHRLYCIISQHAHSIEQCCQELLNTGENHVIPSLAANIPGMGLVESAGIAKGLTSYEVYRNLEEELQALGISDETFQDIQVAIMTKSNLEEYLRANELARKRWEHACEMIFSFEDSSSALTTVSLQQIKFMEEKILQLILPMKEYMVQRNEQDGSVLRIMREVDSLCDIIPKILQDIERIFAAKQIIKSGHTAMFGETASHLGLVIFRYLELMRDVVQTPINATTRGNFYKVATFRFYVDAERLLATLHTIINTQSSSHKSKKAEKERMAVGTGSNNVTGNGMTLVKSGEVRIILAKVERAIAAIHALGIASFNGVESTGGNEDKVEMAHAYSLGRLRQVLGENVQAGLERFQQLLMEVSMEEEHMSQTGKFFGFNLHKWRR